MMGKNDNNNQNRSLLDRTRQEDNTGYGTLLNNINPRQTSDRSNALREQIRSTYSDPNSFLPPGMIGANGEMNYGSIGGGNVDFNSIGDYASARKGYQGLADTGGINRADFSGALGSYGNFMNTGGLTDEDKSNLRYRATSQVPSFYENVKNQMARRQNVQGGYSPGYDSQTAAATRDAARGSYEASRDAEGSIIDRELQGKMFGTSGAADLASRIASMEQGGKIAGLGGLSHLGDADLQARTTNAGLADNAAGRSLTLAQMYQRARENGASGLQSLYSSTPGDLALEYSTVLQGLGGRSGANLQNIGIRSGIKDRKWYDQLPQYLGAAGGIAAGFAGAPNRTY